MIKTILKGKTIMEVIIFLQHQLLPSKSRDRVAVMLTAALLALCQTRRRR
ncbi:MAG: hypothetical protein ONB46_04680 [candidate division KSB1 bacterium]|nr:hypothetical protein [candidate division KSB1 bacterium]MDZ7403211.1 hypothetical protein [candidate division KSB1 bacterium]